MERSCCRYTGCFSLNFIYALLIEFMNHSCSYSNPLVIIVSLKFGYIHEALRVSAAIQMNSLLLAIKISRGKKGCKIFYWNQYKDQIKLDFKIFIINRKRSKKDGQEKAIFLINLILLSFFYTAYFFPFLL